MTDQEKNYFPALTGVRAIAAFMVFFHHANPFNPSGRWLLYSVMNELYIGVSLFFVLSGFLIYWRYEDRFTNYKIRFKAYLQNRFARIYPLYFLLTCFTFIVLYAAGKLPLDNRNIFVIFSNITLIKGFFGELKFTGIGQSWSLTVEACFYLLAPLIFIWWRKFKLLIPVLIILMGVLLVVVFRNCACYGLFSDLKFLMIYTFFGRCFEFFAGVALAQYLKTENPVIRLQFSTYGGLGGILLIMVALVAIRGTAAHGIDLPLGIALNNFVLPMAIVAFLFGLIKEDTWIRRLLSSNLFQVLGRSSYAFYLLHDGIFFSGVYRYMSENILVIFFVINFLAVACYFFVERPLHRLWKTKNLVY
ncbi:MAG: acyltransferase [Chryseolinea sp.]